MDNQNYSNSTLDEIVFENRNKGYGAFLIRKLYNRIVFLALGISTFAFAAALITPLIIQKNTKVVVIEEPKKADTITIVDVPIDPRTPPPPPMPELEVPKIKTVKFVPLEVAKEDKEVREKDPPDQKELNNTTASNENKDGKNDSTGSSATNNLKGQLGGTGTNEEEEQIFTGAVTKRAEPPAGGIQTYLNSHLSDALKSYLEDRQIKGKMFIIITIASDGHVVEAKLLKGMSDCKRCDSEIPELLSKMPNWTPGESNGHKVRLRFSLPVTF